MTSPAGSRLTQLGYAVYSGDDAANLGWLAHGACGFVSVAGHAVGDELRAMVDAFDAGDHAAGARGLHRGCCPAIDAIMGVPNYGATTAKAALQLLGVLDNRDRAGPAGRPSTTTRWPRCAPASWRRACSTGTDRHPPRRARDRGGRATRSGLVARRASGRADATTAGRPRHAPLWSL